VSHCSHVFQLGIRAWSGLIPSREGQENVRVVCESLTALLCEGGRYSRAVQSAEIWEGRTRGELSNYTLSNSARSIEVPL
jgi:hypothetical protein